MHLQRRSKLGRHCLRRPRNPSSRSDSVLVYYVLNQMLTFSLIQVFILLFLFLTMWSRLSRVCAVCTRYSLE